MPLTSLLVAGKTTNNKSPPPVFSGVECSTNKKDWEFFPPPSGTSQKKDVQGQTYYWCTSHAKSRYSTAFVNTGQWVMHKPSDCRLKKQRQDPDAVLQSEPPSSSSSVPSSVPPSSVTVNPKSTYAAVTSRDMLPMRTKLKAMIDNADPTKMASLYAAAMAEDVADGEDL